MAEVHTFGAVDKLMKSAADIVLQAAKESVRLRGRFVWFLSGGSTPDMLYRLLASHQYASRMPWGETFVFWGDERWVPPEDPQSNARMAEEAMLSRVPIPPAQVHRIKTVGLTPQEAAAAAERQLRSLYEGSEPAPDLFLLGLGEDGHTASLFPGGNAVMERNLLFVAEYVPKLQQWRVTATLPLINASRHVVFLATGSAKAQVVPQVVYPQPETIALPASMVRPAKGRLTWLLDAEAGKLLTHLR